MFQVLTYVDDEGHKPYADWLAKLADRHARARVLVRVSRMVAGNFGDCKPVSDGVWELRIDCLLRAIGKSSGFVADRW